jgi:hypothetical protein
MSFSIRNVCDIFFSLSHLLENELGNLEIGIFIISSDIVDRLGLRKSEDFPDSVTMILDIEPITDIGTISIDTHLLISLEKIDKMRDELLMVLIRSIVIRTSSNHIIESICSPICLHDEITSCLARTIWTRWIDRSCLREESSIREIAIYLIGRYMMESIE